jgi:hypothetical protein
MSITRERTPAPAGAPGQLNRKLKSPTHVDSDAATILYEDADNLIRQIDPHLLTVRALEIPIGAGSSCLHDNEGRLRRKR